MAKYNNFSLKHTQASTLLKRNTHVHSIGQTRTDIHSYRIYRHTHLKRWNFACMAALPLAVATVARLRVIPVFGGDLTLGRAN